MYFIKVTFYTFEEGQREMFGAKVDVIGLI